MNLQDLKAKADGLVAAVQANHELLVKLNAKLQAAIAGNDQAAIQAVADEIDAAVKQVQSDDAANSPDGAAPATTPAS